MMQPKNGFRHHKNVRIWQNLEHAEGKIRHSFSLIPMIRSILLYITSRNLWKFPVITWQKNFKKVLEFGNTIALLCQSVFCLGQAQHFYHMLVQFRKYANVCRVFYHIEKSYGVWVNESPGHYYSVAQLQLFAHNFSAADACLHVRQTTADQKKYVK